jgi:adenosine deaminase
MEQQNKAHEFSFPIDYAERINLEMITEPEKNSLRLRIMSPTGRAGKALTQMAEVTVDNTRLKAAEGRNSITCLLPQVGEDLELRVHDELYARLRYDGDGSWHLWKHRAKLTGTETRLVGRDGKDGMFPLKRPRDSKILPPITDLHTHLSAQLSGKQLIEIGMAHDVLYPVEMLERLGIDVPDVQRSPMKRNIFLPEAHLQKNLPPTQDGIPRQQLAAALDLNFENQNSFGDLEECYFLREPFTKNIELIEDIVMQVARDYQKHGVQYAELSTTSLAEQGWLPLMEKAAAEAEKDTGVRLRYLAGMPRNLSDEALHNRLKRTIDITKDSRYVCGIDWLGYESNKTSHIEGHIRHAAKWIAENRPDWTQRIHAGENSKNLSNVDECLDLIACVQKDYPEASFRIGHATFGITKDTLDKAARMLSEGSRFIIETLIDSNIANNTIDFPAESSIMQLANAGIPLTVSTDGAGIYGTDAYQSALVAIATGLNMPLQLEMRATEDKYIDERKAREAKMLQFRGPRMDYYNEMPQLPEIQVDDAVKEKSKKATKGTLRPVTEIQALPKDGRRPILIVGNQGQAWDACSPEEQERVKKQLRALINEGRINPHKHYLALGRLKDDGLGQVVLNCVAEYNHKMESMSAGLNTDIPQLDCYVMDTRPMERSMPEGVTGFLKLNVPLVSVPREIVRLMQEQQVEGEGTPIVIAAGGHAFTGDIILKAMDNHWPVATLDMAGASQKKGANVYRNTFVNSPEALLSFVQERAGISLMNSRPLPNWHEYERKSEGLRRFA